MKRKRIIVEDGVYHSMSRYLHEHLRDEGKSRFA